MAKTERTLEMANLICRFGEKKVLLDMLHEIVLPAFLDGTLRRSYDDTSYLFYDVELVVLDSENSILGIAGRFIKDTVLERDQILDGDKGLIHDNQKMRTSPSAVFLLILNNHRLLYVKETKNAPGLETFRATAQKFLWIKHRNYINALYEKNQVARKADQNVPHISKTDLNIATPRPSVELVPIGSKESLASFLEQFQTLKSVEVQLLDTNSEIDNAPFFEKVREQKDAIGSKKTIVRHTNPEGLDKDVAIEQLSVAAPQGNYQIRFDGLDDAGDRLKGNNEDFKVKTPIGEIGSDLVPAVKRMYAGFNSLVESGLVVIPTVVDAVKRIIAETIERINS